MNFICYNGKTLDAAQPVFTANNRGYRYGDGFFETMRMINGKIPLKDYHVKRIQSSLDLLQYHTPLTPLETIFKEAFLLCEKNNCTESARLRLSFSNGNGSVFAPNTEMDYLIEASSLNGSCNRLNEAGLVIGICPLAKKSCDLYSNLKSANFLIYRTAADYAIKNNWDDSLVLNQHGRIAETTIANIFWIKAQKILTPPLLEGCVNGVMRSYLFDCCQKSGLNLKERECTRDELLNADEVFLTNAVSGMKWVKQFEDKTYSNSLIRELYNSFVAPLLAL